ncbi:hypothetical protein GCM10011351_01640 [Paraliobacillus quinghaiensis]|uniref:DUF4003 domain-containing protein n=1 Tax=Paraliobacillus quinghaiensis TaxID=470815 RepID=A0A917TEK6_9BACI|nr:DUF4003 family protein [Paraliobacillus quinghaiensis]GGM19483.1 hypothetical protein GCM10011351_01640 [Paraliobacillus quinghaiensis]
MKELEEKITKYQGIYQVLKKKLKWKVSNNQINMMVAATYVVNNHPFELKQFMQTADYIKSKVGLFSSLNSQQRFTISAMLDVRFTDPKDKFNQVLECYDLLKSNGFKKGPFTYIAALVLLQGDEDEDKGQKAEKAYRMYKKMRSDHPILTSSGDYPLAVLLANREGEVDSITAHVEYFYQTLDKNGFYKGNNLQFLSHILSLDPSIEKNLLTERCFEITKIFQQKGVKTKIGDYPQIGMLALMDDGIEEIDKIRDVMEQLNEMKEFKWYKDLNRMMAFNFVVSEKLADHSIVETGMMTTMETIIQAQQAAMIAATAGAVAANSANS